MTRIALIRHGPTDWNRARRIQGRTDIPLGDDGRAVVASWRLPPEIEGFDWIASPLARAVETAQALGVPMPIATDPRLVEMDWGAWEGLTLAELRARFGDVMRANEARGLDFRPAGGESPRDVQARVGDWLADVAERGRPVAAVVHKGVLRAVYALATGWDMMTRPPDEVEWGAIHFFAVAADGTPAVERLNVPLDR